MKLVSEKPVYSVPVKCSNCDYDGEKEILKGCPVAEKMECPNCGCETATKVPPKPTSNYRGVDQSVPEFS